MNRNQMFWRLVASELPVIIGLFAVAGVLLL